MTNDKPACRGEDTELFYRSEGWAEAAQICRRCPLAVKLQCRMDFAEDGFAYAGGMTPTQRFAWARQERSRGAKIKPTLSSRARRVRMTPEERTEIFRIFDTELVGTKAIADRMSMSKSTIQRVLRESGRRRTPEEELELSRRGGLSGGVAAMARRNDELIMSLFAAGNAPKDVATLSGMSLAHVYMIRRRHVLKMFDDGLAVDVIAKAVNMTENQVLRTRERHA